MNLVENEMIVDDGEAVWFYPDSPAKSVMLSMTHLRFNNSLIGWMCRNTALVATSEKASC